VTQLITSLTPPLFPETLSLDSSSGVVMPFWSDNGVLFLAGKGDGNIRYYELESDEFHYLTEHKSVEPARGMTFVPRRCLNASENEIARAYKVTGNMVQPISFYVPRRAESFQSDIFPPAPSSIPSLNAQELFGGNKSSEPNYISLEDGAGVAGEAPPPSFATAPAPAPAPTPAPISSTSSNTPSRQTSATEVQPTPTPTASAPAPSPSIPTSTQQTSLPTPSRANTSSSSQAASPSQTAAPPGPQSTFLAKTNGKGSAVTNGGGGDTSGVSFPSEIGSFSESILTCALFYFQFEAQLQKLKLELAEKDAIIRSLEVENEK